MPGPGQTVPTISIAKTGGIYNCYHPTQSYAMAFRSAPGGSNAYLLLIQPKGTTVILSPAT